MRDDTIAALERLNRTFYATNARAFSRTREAPWPGWARVFEHVAAVHAKSAGTSVLDVGSGNGRLLRALAHTPSITDLGPITYVGVDASEALLDDARARLALLATSGVASLSLVAADVLEPGALDALPRAGFVAAMGLLHHVPSRARRLALVDALATQVAARGVLAVSLWRFGGDERFAAKVVPWSACPDVDTSDLEPGDVLLSFEGRDARYCHAIDDAEVAAIVAHARSRGLGLAADFVADGKTGALNRHLVFVR